jgi:hypothetical protein
LARHALEETIQFSEAVRSATEKTDENDTLSKISDLLSFQGRNLN